MNKQYKTKKIFEKYRFGDRRGYARQGVEFYTLPEDKRFKVQLLAVNIVDANIALKLAIKEAFDEGIVDSVENEIKKSNRLPPPLKSGGSRRVA